MYDDMIKNRDQFFIQEICNVPYMVFYLLYFIYRIPYILYARITKRKPTKHYLQHKIAGRRLMRSIMN